MAWRIYYTISHVNKAWEKQVKEAKHLSGNPKARHHQASSS